MITLTFFSARASVWRAVGLALFGIGLGAAGVGSAAEIGIATAVSPLSLPIYVAQAEGLFAAEAVDVRLIDCFAGDACLQQIFAGSAQLATASELPVIFSAFERSDFAIVATLVTSQSDVKVVVRRSAGIQSAAQLAGKRVGMVPRSSSHYFFDSFMLFNGIDPKDVKQVPLKIGELVPSLERREVDAIVGYSRQGWQAKKLLAGDGLVLPNPRIYTQTFNLIASRQVIDGRRAELIKVLRALDRAERLIAEKPARARDILRDRLKLDPAFIDEAFKALNFRLSLDQSLVATMAGEARWAVREGHVRSGRIPPDHWRFVELAPLRAAVPSIFQQ